MSRHSPAGGEVTLRVMREADIDRGVALVRASGWNQTAREWRLFLELAPRTAFVAERNGGVVGTAVTVPYEPGVGWVAMVLVDAAERGRGIGRALLTHAIAHAPDGHVPCLDATPAGRALYLTLGFEDVAGLSRWRHPSRPSATARGPVRPLQERDWSAVLDVDRAVTGIDRRRVLAWLRDGARDLAWTMARGPEQGYALGRRGCETDHIGPVVAASDEEAIALIGASLSCVSREGVSVDVPDHHARVGEWLRARGFVVERPFTRMRRGSAESAALSPQVVASIGPEFG